MVLAPRLALHGEAKPILAGVRYEKGFFRGVFDASTDGKLVYQPGATHTTSQLVWFDRSGKRVGTVGEPGELYDVRISPDGQQVLVAIDDPSDLWMYEVSRGVRTRVTFGSFGEQNPVFSPDGSSILFSSDRSTLYDMFRRTLSGQAAETPLLTSRNLNEYPLDWNASFILYESEDLVANTQSDLWVLPVNGGKPFPIVQSPAQDTTGRISPDGKWVAYTSFESGQPEVYVTSFPQGSGKWQVSQGGAGAPSWRADGQEIYFVQGEKIMAASVKSTAGTFAVGEVVELFTVPIKSLPPPFYDAAADGSRFLVNTLLERTEGDPIVVVTNWPQILEER